MPLSWVEPVPSIACEWLGLIAEGGLLPCSAGGNETIVLSRFRRNTTLYSGRFTVPSYSVLLEHGYTEDFVGPRERRW